MELIQQQTDPAAAWGWDFGAESEIAEDGVGDDLIHHFDIDVVGVFRLWRDAGEVGAGDLEAVKEQAGSFGVDLVACDTGEDLADGALDSGTVLRHADVEAGSTAAVLVRILDGAAGGVVVVAEVFVAEAWAAAALAAGEDVTALQACGCVGHGRSPLGAICVKVLKR